VLAAIDTGLASVTVCQPVAVVFENVALASLVPVADHRSRMSVPVSLELR
jgi:hypothetical protein